MMRVFWCPGHTLPRCCLTLMLTEPTILCSRCRVYAHTDAKGETVPVFPWPIVHAAANVQLNKALAIIDIQYIRSNDYCM